MLLVLDLGQDECEHQTATPDHERDREHGEDREPSGHRRRGIAAHRPMLGGQTGSLRGAVGAQDLQHRGVLTHLLERGLHLGVAGGRHEVEYIRYLERGPVPGPRFQLVQVDPRAANGARAPRRSPARRARPSPSTSCRRGRARVGPADHRELREVLLLGLDAPASTIRPETAAASTLAIAPSAGGRRPRRPCAPRPRCRVRGPVRSASTRGSPRTARAPANGVSPAHVFQTRTRQPEQRMVHADLSTPRSAAGSCWRAARRSRSRSPPASSRAVRRRTRLPAGDP